MVKCRDIAKMNLDGMWLLAGKAGLSLGRVMDLCGADTTF